ncbi:hypothetical protein D9757_001613 [Collybiopsis confluens]|uniref:Thioredoxin domain-containing protein n=1 Tax=Collybiopsis confluens TaxID=2823264 RepID=A0A8H5HZK6_9AGAR|nr:hypothetical protein D9757_001613 [Collybiopsis confluens]
MANVRPELNVGATAPDFESTIASGPLKYHEWVGESWSIVFSHPESALVTELTELARKLPDIEKRGVKVVGFSRDWSNEGAQWGRILQDNGPQSGLGKDVHILSDEQARMSTLYGMISDQNSGATPSVPNTTFLVDHKKVIKLVLTFPTCLSTGFDQILQFVDDNAGPLQDLSAETFGLDVHGKPLPSQVTSTTGQEGEGKAARVVTIVAGATNYIQQALAIMDNIADIGKDLPFVSPAFILLKTIIDIEQRAQDVDTKCVDLVQRCTFMLSHLPALKNIKITDSTRQVIDRMNEVLKKAAALIQAYRKQGVIARRLSIQNKDRFVSCASSLTDCTNDLTISLQIHQSTQLDILIQPAPSDPADEEAAKWVAAHGGIDAVRSNEALVKQFASEMKLSVDDKVMEQLNTNITEALQQNQDRLEQSLNEIVSASVIEGIKGLAARLNESANEPTFICVQCDKEFRDSTNGDKSCSFHVSEIYTASKNYACCGAKNPCQVRRHRSEHHCDYLYGKFFLYARQLVVDQWIDIKDYNFDTKEEIEASVGRVTHMSGPPELPTILIRVGNVSPSTPYLFKTYNTHDLEVASKTAEITHQTVIFRTSHSKDQFGIAEWELSAGVITGITVSVKAATSSKPFVRYCPIDITTATVSGEIKAKSEGGFRSYKPNKPYVLPKVQKVTAILPERALRAVRKDFKTRTSSKLPVVLSVMSDPRWWPMRNSLELRGTISPGKYLFSIKTRLAPRKLSPSLHSLELVNGTTLPASIDPRQNWTMKFIAHISRSEEEQEINTKWWNSSFIARKRPLRLKLVLKDIEDEECSLVLDYVFPGVELSKPSWDSLGYFYIEEPRSWNRYGIDITKPLYEGDSVVLAIRHSSLNTETLKAAVYQAQKSDKGESEIDLKIGQTLQEGMSDAWTWKCWALVDLSCQAVYAFKILITKDIVGTTGYACLAYVPCPQYGEVLDEERPIQYANELVQFPTLDLYVPEPVMLDDEFDDFVPEAVPPPPPPTLPAGVETSAVGVGGNTTSTSAAQLVIPDDVRQRLISIDDSLSRQAATSIEQNTSLARIAVLLEQLIENLKAK